jgi:hypothetical protein
MNNLDAFVFHGHENEGDVGIEVIVIVEDEGVEVIHLRKILVIKKRKPNM